MKKFIKRVATILVALVMCMPMFACGDAKVDNSLEDTNTLKIIAVERGYGVKMIESWVERFKEIYPDVDVELKVVVEASNATTFFELGPDYNDYDLFFTVGELAASKNYAYRNEFDGYNTGLMDYTDIYNSNVYGESVTFGEKINQTIKPYMQNVEKTGYYAIPWASAIQSIILNTTVVNEALGSSYDIPNTTDKLLSFAREIKSKGYTPFIYPGQLNYWGACFHQWWAQYEGIEDYRMFYEGKCYSEEQGTYVYSENIYKQQGRLEALKVMESLLTYDKNNEANNLHELNVNDYNINNFTTLQKKFLHSSYTTSTSQKYAMYPNGDWLASESASSSSDDIIMMKMPVISSIISKCDSIADDNELSALINAIDNKDASLIGTGYDVTQADYDRVKDARETVYSQSNTHIAYSPVYANAKNLIKNFILFIASDEAIEICKNCIKPGIMPYNYNYNFTDDFSKSVYDLYSNTYIFSEANTLLNITDGIVSTSTNSGYYEAVLGCDISSKNHMSAQEIFESEFITSENYTLILRNAGLLD